MAKNDFFSDVYEVVKLIPEGRATSYGAIASYLSRKNARIVGWAMSGCSAHPDVPAHRVVNSAGCLTAKSQFGPDDQLQRLLESEGIQVKNDRIQDWSRVFWDPSKEL